MITINIVLLRLFKKTNFLKITIIKQLYLKMHMEQINKSMKDKVLVRWGILLLVAFVQGANYYFYDAISPLKTTLEQNFGFTSSDFGLFVSMYSLPNTFLLMAIFGGIILDKIGIRRTGITFISLMTAGGVVTAYGASTFYTNGGPFYEIMSSFLPKYSPELKMMLLGRFLFGLGAETSIVVISKTIVKWFKGKELALAFGTKIGIARLGGAASLYFTVSIKDNTSHWTLAIWFAVLLLCIGLLAFIFYTFFDRKLDRQIEGTQLQSVKDEFKISDLTDLFTNRSFIYVTLLCMTFYAAIMPFQSFSADFILNNYGEINQALSGKIAAILSIGTFVFTPIFGFLVDRYGKSASLMILGSVMLVVIHLTFAFTNIHPSIPLLFLGIAFALVPAAMWPSIAKIIDEKKIGTAYGAMFTIQNLGLWGVPLLIGIILDSTNPDFTNEAKAAGAKLDYTWAMIMFAALGILGVVFALLLKREDKVSGYGLELPSNTKK
jgi:MFS family permease